jgi:hypothetical protein
MSVLIGLLPFILLDLLRAAVSRRIALLISVALAAATVVQQVTASSPKSLSILALLLIGAAAAISFWRPAFAERGSGLLVSGGLTLFVFVGLAFGEPFSAEYARDSVPQAYWTHPLFLHTTWAISLVWGLAFAGLTLLTLSRNWPARRWQRSAIAVLMMLAAGSFTAWYPGHVQAAAQAAARPAK